jgi:hypothetical protein
MTDHVDAAAVAMLREGLLSADEAAAVSAHLAGCDRCGQLDSQLAFVSGLLATAPGPPMPPALAARIEAALAAEAAAQAAGPAAAATGTPAAEVPAAGQPARPSAAGSGTGPGRRGRAGTAPGTGRPSRRRAARGVARSRTWLGAMAAAAAIVVIGGGGYAISQLAAQSGPGATASSAAAPRAAASHRNAPAAGMMPNSSAPAGKPAVAAVFSGTDYTQQQLSSQVLATLRRYPAGSSMRMGAAGERALPALTLSACVNALTRGQHPRLVDVARYQGRPATIIVVTGAGTTPGRIWVVGPGCTASRPDLLAQSTLPAAAG